MEFPEFKYYCVPPAKGCFGARDFTCVCCDKTRNIAYTGPVYGRQTIGAICPWCILDGSAATKYELEFNGLLNAAEGVAKAVLDEIRFRTPGFNTWQGNEWLFSAKDALVFCGEVDGKQLLKEAEEAAVNVCLQELRRWQQNATQEDLACVGPQFDLSMYLFCDPETGAYAVYSDAS